MVDATAHSPAQMTAQMNPQLPRAGIAGLRASLRRVVLAAIGLLITLAVWAGVASLLGPQRLPSPLALWPSIFTDLTSNKILEFQGGGSNGILPHLLYTIRQTLLGSALGAIIGVGIGLGAGRSEWFRAFIQLPIGFLRAVPPLAAVPFAVLWFGPAPAAQLGIVVFYVALMMVVTTDTAIANLDPLQQQFARTLGASENRVFGTVVLPAIVPDIVGGLRVAVGLAWGIEVIAELAGSPLGMGQVFSRMVSFQELRVIIIGILWITFAAAITDALIVFVSRAATRWVPRTTD